MAKIVIALGGNALGKSPEEQLNLVKNTAKSLAGAISQGHKITISHGNGPQVGAINLGMNYANEHNQGPAFPFPECGAMSQGYIGYHLQQSLQNELNRQNITQDVVTLITQVEVEADDPAFKNPTKPIGTFYSKKQAEKIEKEKNYIFKEDAGRGYRQVIASPMPKNIIEIDSVNRLINNNNVVIAGGGGGIPVLKSEGGNIKGVSAVIDKDRSSALLADNIVADKLIILTAVEYVYMNYGKSDQEALQEIDSKQAKDLIQEKQFATGSMLPKIEACLDFVTQGKDREAIITSLENLDDALAGKTGTIIKK
ncbi:carbamate kinase [Tetragenococcus halophilus subsp. halophilus]|uniref:Carbamate kinase n=4 Tax=Tetragenococcus TaxID=51668 RepID=A0A2H6D7F4_TETHA|nr:carbamate kinase [Tetragenococcus halophilus]MDN6599052.1 carbamate kinase [Tetragenococcus koreensis]MCF1601843.1 carbamate kinase [Tetragenococcus halophilus]MCF1675731.1 carbamate kinase [Tetragenococcus halophilus]MCO7027357.1 carbamate kinase [Tetragenococcus halophilus]MCO8284974.1 carbamate kinase [Tetragenococcus halophilus]